MNTRSLRTAARQLITPTAWTMALAAGWLSLSTSLYAGSPVNFAPSHHPTGHHPTGHAQIGFYPLRTANPFLNGVTAINTVHGPMISNPPYRQGAPRIGPMTARQNMIYQRVRAHMYPYESPRPEVLGLPHEARAQYRPGGRLFRRR